MNREYLIVRRGDTVHVLLAGQLDVLAAPAITRAIERALAVQTERILLNLDAVTFLDSAGLGAIVAGYHDAVRLGVDYTIGPAATVAVGRVLAVTGLDEYLSPDKGVRDESGAPSERVGTAAPGRVNHASGM